MLLIVVEVGEDLLSCRRIHVSFLRVHALNEVRHAHLMVHSSCGSCLLMLLRRNVGQLISDLNRHESPGATRRVLLEWWYDLDVFASSCLLLDGRVAA